MGRVEDVTLPARFITTAAHLIATLTIVYDSVRFPSTPPAHPSHPRASTFFKRLTSPLPFSHPQSETVKRTCWDRNQVFERHEVEAEYRARGETAHFGTINPLCHEKHAELMRHWIDKEYKGRVIFRGDIVRDEAGYYAVFSEQGSSASHMAAAKFLDAIA